MSCGYDMWSMPPSEEYVGGLESYEDKWAIDLPDDFEKSNAIANLNQQIFEHWLRQEGPCDGCSNYYRKERCHPRDGRGNADANLMFVGRVPGSPSEIEKPNSNRKADREKIQKQPEFQGKPLAAFYNRNIEKMYGWNGISTLRKQLFEDDFGVQYGLEDIYFTNVKKCHDVVGDSNSTARDRCVSYLANEIRLIEPEVIVTWGPDAAKGTSDVLQYDRDQLPNEVMKLPPGDTRPTSEFIGYRMADPYLITMPHWSGIRAGNYENIPGYYPEESSDEGEIKKIYHELGGLINHLTG